MSDGPNTLAVQPPHFSLVDRVANLTAFATGVAVFMGIGWLAFEPVDPRGAVSLLASHGSLLVVLEAAALAAVTAGFATVIAGRKLADVGTFATAIGMVAVSLRGSPASFLLLQSADGSLPPTRTLAFQLALESIGWMVAIVVSVIVSAMVMKWCYGIEPEGDTEEARTRSATVRSMAGFDIPRLSSRWLGIPPDRQTNLVDGLRHMAIVAAAGVMIISVLSSSLSARSIQHGQSCFLVAAGVCLACHLAHRLSPVRSASWSLAAVLLVALIGYGWSVLYAPESPQTASIPVSHFLRALPIQYIGVGAASAVFMFSSTNVSSIYAQGRTRD